MLTLVPTKLDVVIISTASTRNNRYLLKCEALVSTGESITYIAWYKSGQLLAYSTKDKSLTYNLGTIVAENNGNYTCRVEVGNFVKIRTLILENSISKFTA